MKKKVAAKKAKKKRPVKAKIIRDPRTGLPALTLGPNAPKLMHKQVKKLLADFP